MLERPGPSQDPAEVQTPKDHATQIAELEQEVLQLLQENAAAPVIKKKLLRMMQLVNQMGAAATDEYRTAVGTTISRLGQAINERTTQQKQETILPAAPATEVTAAPPEPVVAAAAVQAVQAEPSLYAAAVGRKDQVGAPTQKTASGPSVVQHRQDEELRARTEQTDADKTAQTKKIRDFVKGFKQTKDHYKVLGVEANATPDQIKKAFRALATLLHTDRLPALGITDETEVKQILAVLARISEAYTVLSKPESRHEYDAERQYDFWRPEEDTTPAAHKPEGRRQPKQNTGFWGGDLFSGGFGDFFKGGFTWGSTPEPQKREVKKSQAELLTGLQTAQSISEILDILDDLATLNIAFNYTRHDNYKTTVTAEYLLLQVQQLQDIYQRELQPYALRPAASETLPFILQLNLQTFPNVYNLPKTLTDIYEKQYAEWRKNN